MEVTYKTNGVITTPSMAEWYFGKKFVENMTTAAKAIHEASGKTEHKFWQDGTGYLTIVIH